MTPEDAIGLGTLRRDLPNEVEITTKGRLETLNGSATSHLIARTNEYIVYRHGQPALVLIDVDTKGMPAAVKDRIDTRGGFWPALVSVLPELETAGRVARKSTSAGLSRADTGERLVGSNGEHVFIPVTDGTDAERFLKTMHDRCWLHGFGWLMVGAGGQLLDRSLVDRMVAAPERLVYALGHMIAGPLPDIIYRSEKRQRRRPGQWVRIRRSGGYRRKLPVDWEREFIADRAQLLDVHGEYATAGGRDWLTRGNFTKGTWAEKVADHIGWRDGGPEVRAALQAKHEAAIAHGKMLADRIRGRAPPDDKRYQADDVGGSETLIALADRLRALMVQNDPDALRAGLADIADALDSMARDPAAAHASHGQS
jgi:hypothetical protein